MKVYIDQGVNQKIMRSLKKSYCFEIFQARDIEQNIPIATDIPHPFVIGRSPLDSGDYIADDNISDISRVIGGGNIIGKGEGTDALHLHTAFRANCDYFVTNNPKHFIYGNKAGKKDDRRQELEKILDGMKIVTLDEFENILEAK